MAFFELRTPRDMLNKAERELARFRQDFNIDNVFNFFVTAHHIQDYVRVTAAIPQASLETFLQDPDIKACRDLCDKGKHLSLTKRQDPVTHMASGCYGGAAYGELAYGEGERWSLLYNDHAVDIHSLPDRVITKWKQFLDHHGL